MKNMLIGGIVGLLFMAGGFYGGMKLNPPPKPKPAAVAEVKPVDPILPPKNPISIDDLRKTSESMMTLNSALKLREDAVNDREAKLHAKEDEFAAERQTLDDSHAKFKALFAEFQQRLDLVEANQLDQLHKQAELYSAMGDQAIDLLRPMDDAAVTRLFSVMDVKPLSKLVSTWKTKYPTDAARLLKSLDDMAKVMPKEKIALSDPSMASTAPASLTPASDAATQANPLPDATTTPAAPTTDPAAPAPFAAAPAANPPVPVVATDPATPAVASSTDASTPTAPPSLAPPPDPSPTQIPASKMPPDTNLPAAPRPASASNTVGDPVPTTSTTPDLTTPGATASTPIPDPAEALPNIPVAPVASPADLDSAATRAPRALPVTVNTAAAQ